MHNLGTLITFELIFDVNFFKNFLKVWRIEEAQLHFIFYTTSFINFLKHFNNAIGIILSYNNTLVAFEGNLLPLFPKNHA